MGDVKQVKVDNWGTFFLQRLKHFFNRTDYCDLTLQFQDNAQLKVHRLVLNACTEYFELLERTCEMYEDCLIMPEDLQADVVVPIVNFMYTGQLEYQPDLLNKLYQTAQIMNMAVLTKLLDAHRSQQPKYKQLNNQNSYSRSTPKKTQPSTFQSKNVKSTPAATRTPVASRTSIATSRTPVAMRTPTIGPGPYQNLSTPRQSLKRKHEQLPARPTRYEIPEELEKEGFIDNFENSFEDLSYESRPLMTHPKNSYSAGLYDEPSSSKLIDDFAKRSNEVEFKRLKTKQEPQLFNELEEFEQEDDPFEEALQSIGAHQSQTSTQHFDHVIEMEGAKVTIETKSVNEKPIDHAKIISEVLKKYPHLVKNNKNIKLKIVSAPSKSENKTTKSSAKAKQTSQMVTKVKREIDREFTYETDITDTKEIGRLISLGVENVKGPWLCLICGTPGKAVNFPSYHKFRNHLVEYHNEIPPSNMCEYCGFKSGKRNHLLYHVLTKHGVQPPPSYNFPKCNQCSYIGLNKAMLVKHRLTHCQIRKYTCNVCQMNFNTSTNLLQHIKQTGHKICPDRRSNHQCIYCLKTFLREHNLYAHLRSTHKIVAKNDGIIDVSDEEENDGNVKREPSPEDFGQGTEEEEDDDVDETEEQYQINAVTGNFEIISKKNVKPQNQKILNQSFSNSSATPAKRLCPLNKVQRSVKQVERSEPSTSKVNETDTHTNIIHTQNERLLKDSATETEQQSEGNEYLVPEMIDTDGSQNENTAFPQQLSQEISEPELMETHINQQSHSLTNKQISVNQPYQIVVSSEQEYKALMAANPSIIFQDGTEGKAMAVMSHANIMETGNMQLDGSQNSNMMIIPDDYSINVSQTLPVESSNIVVVYSHNMGQHDLQYSEQLITNQNGQSQLVPSSQVITTISNNPMQQSMIIEQPIEQWHNESHITTLQPAEPLISHMAIQHQSETVIESTETISNPTIADKGLTEGTEIQLIGQPGNIMNEEVISEPTEIIQNTVITQTDGVYHQEVQQMESVELNNHNNEVVISDQNVTSEIDKDIQNDNVPEDMQEHEAIENQIVEGDTNENLDTSIESESSQELPENEASSLPINEKIQELASEWSDDETTKIPEVIAHQNEIVVTETIPVRESITAENSEVEESIENIQQEMENQVISPQIEKKIIITSDVILPSTAAIITKSKSISSEPGVASKTVEINPSSSETRENKISSLLNDWDDNDTTEENSSQTSQTDLAEPNEDVGGNSEESKENETETESVAPQSELNEENIPIVKKIISDWEDEEEKEE